MDTAQIIAEASQISTATLHEAAGKRGNLPSAIKPVDPGMKLCGRALTVFSPPADNLWLHRAIYEAKPGEILVVDVGNFTEAGYWGDVMTYAAQLREIGGLVINGGVRDREQLIDMKFPVFSIGVCIKGTGKDQDAYGAMNQLIRMGDTSIAPGDLVVGDSNGVVVIPWNRAEEVIAKAKKRDADEERIKEQLKQGKSTLEIYSLHSKKT